MSAPLFAVTGSESKLRAGFRDGHGRRRCSKPEEVHVFGPWSAQSTQQRSSENLTKKQDGLERFIRKSRKKPPKSGPRVIASGPHSRGRSLQDSPPVFVGPMDHSYRAVIGNLAETPPSTIALHAQMGHYNPNGGNGCGSSYLAGLYDNRENTGNAYAPEPLSARMREDAPLQIYCVIKDVYPVAKISASARRIGVPVEFVNGDGDRDLLAELAGMPEAARPSLIVVDLNNVSAKPLTLIPRLRSMLKKRASIIGIVSRVQGDLKMRGAKAGCDTVVSRAAFSMHLPNLLRRYGLEEKPHTLPASHISSDFGGARDAVAC